MLDVTNLTVAYGNTVIIDHLSFHADSGEIVSIVGPSGVGKSTLLRALCGLIRISEGTIVVDGAYVTAVPTHRRAIGLMSQSGDLFPTMSVGDNIAFGLRMAKVPRATQKQRVDELLHLVGLEGFEDRAINTLSGGQARRVALARTLAPLPRVVLLDEPLVGLDIDTAQSLLEDLQHILRTAGLTTLYVSHEHPLPASHRSIVLSA